MLLTETLLNEGKSDNGAWSKAQLECLGLSYPLVSGWKDRIIGSEFDEEKIGEFLSLKNAHLKVLSDKQFVAAAHKLFEKVPTDELRAECPFDLPDDEYYRKGARIEDAEEMRRHLTWDFKEFRIESSQMSMF